MCALSYNGSQRGSSLALLFMEDHAAKVVSSYVYLTGTHFLMLECIYKCVYAKIFKLLSTPALNIPSLVHLCINLRWSDNLTKLKQQLFLKYE